LNGIVVSWRKLKTILISIIIDIVSLRTTLNISVVGCLIELTWGNWLLLEFWDVCNLVCRLIGLKFKFTVWQIRLFFIFLVNLIFLAVNTLMEHLSIIRSFQCWFQLNLTLHFISLLLLLIFFVILITLKFIIPLYLWATCVISIIIIIFLVFFTRIPNIPIILILLLLIFFFLSIFLFLLLSISLFHLRLSFHYLQSIKCIFICMFIPLILILFFPLVFLLITLNLIIIFIIFVLLILNNNLWSFRCFSFLITNLLLVPYALLILRISILSHCIFT